MDRKVRELHDVMDVTYDGLAFIFSFFLLELWRDVGRTRALGVHLKRSLHDEPQLDVHYTITTIQVQVYIV